MKLLAVKFKKSLGVPANPQARFAGSPKQYSEGEYAVLTEEQVNFLNDSVFELICEVKKPVKKSRKKKVESPEKEGA